MPDFDDDWMHPEYNNTVYTDSRKEREERLAKNRFVIQRQRRIICSFHGEPPTTWEVWSEHPSEKERDSELARLHKEHPSWRLRPRNRDFRGRIREPYGP